MAGERVLIVDDSPTVLHFTAAALVEAGYRVETCDNIWFSSQVARFRPHLILLDVRLGASLGTAAVKALRYRSFAGQAQVFLYSTIELEELQRLADECGADGVLAKKRDPEYIRQNVQRIFEENAGAS